MIESAVLLEKANAARQRAYAPYSGFAVGAALLSENGQIFTGCNIENASFGVTCCAERTALFQAVSQGVTRFSALAVVGAPIGEPSTAPCPPCGICRQALAEFCGDDLVILLGEQTQTTLGELFTCAFRPHLLQEEHDT